MHQQRNRSLKYWKQKKIECKNWFVWTSPVFYPSWELGVSGGEKKQRSVRGRGGALTLLLQQGSTFSENKNFSDTRISSPNKIKDKSYTLFFSCMSLVWFNVWVKSRRIHTASQYDIENTFYFLQVFIHSLHPMGKIKTLQCGTFCCAAPYILLPQLFNTVWVLACSIIPLHGFLSCAFCFQLFTPIFLKSSFTSSSHHLK